jgi:hypothetical protein
MEAFIIQFDSLCYVQLSSTAIHKNVEPYLLRAMGHTQNTLTFNLVNAV